MSRRTDNGVRRSIDDLLKIVEKSAASQGTTTHPSKSVDDGTHNVSLGAHGNEDNATLKEQEALGVAKATPNTGGQQADAQTNMGIQAKPTGEDPSVEDDYKDKKDDPGSTMPARTDNSALDGKKYAAFRDTFTKSAAALTASLMEELQAAQPAKPAAGAAPVKTAEAAAETNDAAAGRTLAETVIGGELNDQEKQAADAIVLAQVTGVVKQASQLADDLIDYYRGHQKSAEEAAMAGAGGAGPGPAGGQMDPALLEALMSGGSQMPETSMGEMTGAGGGGGGEAPPGGGDIDPEALMQALQSLPPEVLQQLLAEISGEGGGGAPPGDGGGGGPPMDSAAGGGDPAAAMAGAGGAETKMASARVTAQKKVASHRAALLEILGRSSAKK